MAILEYDLHSIFGGAKKYTNFADNVIRLRSKRINEAFES